MTVSFGRVGFAAPTLNDPTSMTLDGEDVTFTGVQRSTSAAQAVVLRDQIRGLNDNVDEPVVPVFFSDAALDSYEGLYRIVSASASVAAGDVSSWVVRWTIRATRSQSYQQPFVESRCVFPVITNSHGITTATALCTVGTPGAAVTEVSYSDGTISLFTFYTSEDGSVMVADAVPGSWTGDTGVFRWATSLPTWYYGGSRIKVNGDIVVGRQCVDTPTSWSIENGLVKVAASSSAGFFDVSHYDGSQYDTAKTFVLDERTAASIPATGFHHVSVLRNGPEACTLRLGVQNNGGYAVNCDVTIRRGSRWVELVVTSGPLKWGIRRGTAEAATSITGGIRATSNDASGNRYVLSMPNAFTSDLVAGLIYPTSASSRMFLGIGCEVAGTSAVSPSTALAQVYRFIGQTYEVARVVGR